MTGQTILDLKNIEKAKIILTSPKNWDIFSRRWKQRKVIKEISLFIVDDIHMMGETNANFEVCLARMRYIMLSLKINMRFVALGAPMANY